MSGAPKRRDAGRIQPLLVNALILPGLGTVLNGRKRGYIQLLLSITGLVFSGLFLNWMWRLFRQGKLIETMDSWSGPAGYMELIDNPQIRLGWLGVMLFTLSWIWSILDSAKK